MMFMKGKKGMMLEIDESYRSNDNVLCCDVSWISSFGEAECEVLIARSKGDKNNFRLQVVDENEYGVQTVSLTQRQS